MKMAEKVISESKVLVDDFLDFLNESWTAFHATAEARRRLLAAGFVELDEAQPTHHVVVSSSGPGRGTVEQQPTSSISRTWPTREGCQRARPAGPPRSRVPR